MRARPPRSHLFTDRARSRVHLGGRRPHGRAGRPTAAALCVVAWLAPGAAGSDQGLRVGDTTFPATCALAPVKKLPPRGGHVYQWMGLFDAFTAALYDDPAQRSKPALGPVPRCLMITYHRAFSAAQFAETTTEGIARNSPKGAVKRLRSSIDAYNRLYADVKVGDRYALAYAPGRGTTLYLNGRSRGHIPGDDFAAALFAIWLGPEPVSEGLRDDLLGR